MMSEMSDLDARPVDPRDQGREIWNPAYRVCYWHRFESAWASREFEVSGGDIGSVLARAAERAENNETYTVFAVVHFDDEVGLVRLAGDDPTRADSTWLPISPRGVPRSRSVGRGPARSGHSVRPSAVPSIRRQVSTLR
jgi:hypothetical protein